MIDACDGWATRQLFSLPLTDRDGTEIETASDYATYESKDGRRLRFTLTQMTQGAVTARIPLSPVRGGGAQGFRTWWRRTDLPAVAVGRHVVDVVTSSGQLIGRLRFRITP